MGENIGKNISKNLSDKYSQKLLDHAKQFGIDSLKSASKKQFEKQQKQMVILLVINSLIKLQKYQKLHSKIIQKH